MKDIISKKVILKKSNTKKKEKNTNVYYISGIRIIYLSKYVIKSSFI
jgi:hypothetical protein